MIVINFDEYNLNRDAILGDLAKSLFVYPTDTIYGIGCNALDEKLVGRIRKIKGSGQTFEQPFSVIVPNKEWIYANCVVTEEAEEWIRKLPGPYTLIMKMKNPKAVAMNVHNIKGKDITLGIRMPNHWFLAVAYNLKFPVVTTSANISGQNFMTSLEDLDNDIRRNVDYVFYDGPKIGRPSTIIHLEGSKIMITPRTERFSRGVKINFPLEEIQLTRKK